MNCHMNCRIREILSERHLPVMWLCAATLFTPATIHNWASNKTVPSLTDARKVADAFGIPVDQIWVPEHRPQQPPAQRLAGGAA